MKLENNILYAEENHVLIRKSDKTNYGKQIYLGYSYYINGELLSTPHLDTINDFEEIPISNNVSNEYPNINENDLIKL